MQDFTDKIAVVSGGAGQSDRLGRAEPPIGLAEIPQL